MLRKRLLTVATVLFSISFAFPASAEWRQDAQNHWFYEKDGASLTNTFEEIDGKTYYFNNAGIMVVGEQYIAGKAYTFDSSGALLHEGIHRDGLEDDLLTDAFIKTHENWAMTEYGVSLMNAERASYGLYPLQADFDATVMATYRCAHMNKYGYFDHYLNGEMALKDVMNHYFNAYVYCYIELCYYRHKKDSYCGTNEQEALSAHNSFINSPSHHEGMLDNEVTLVGVGYYRRADNKKIYCTVVEMTPAVML